MLQQFFIFTLILLVFGKEYDDVKAPKTFYPIEPEKIGKLLFLSGPPGSGKSTIALQLAKDYGYKYYEGDCFFWTRCNPYIPLDSVEPHTALGRQPKMKVSLLALSRL